MALTDQSDLFASVTEDGFNRFATHIMRKRPSLFNYGTQFVADNWRKLLCEPPDVAPEVLRHDDIPVVTVEDPLPILGTKNRLSGLNFGIQLVKLHLDLHPQTTGLPPELGKLQEQQFSLSVDRGARELGCASERTLERLPPAPFPPFRPVEHAEAALVGDPDAPGRPRQAEARPAEAARHHPRRAQLAASPCPPTSSSVSASSWLWSATSWPPDGAKVIEAKLDGLEIVDIQPDCLEANLECYLRMLMHYVLLPRLRIAMSASLRDPRRTGPDHPHAHLDRAAQPGRRGRPAQDLRRRGGRP